MYQITYVNQLKKDFKRVDKHALLALKTQYLPVIVNDPYGVGERLTGSLHIFWVYKFHHQGVQFRVAYQIIQEKLLIVLVQFGTRENFYKELKRRVKARRLVLSVALVLAVFTASLALAPGVARGQSCLSL